MPGASRFPWGLCLSSGPGSRAREVSSQLSAHTADNCERRARHARDCWPTREEAWSSHGLGDVPGFLDGSVDPSRNRGIGVTDLSLSRRASVAPSSLSGVPPARVPWLQPSVTRPRRFLHSRLWREAAPCGVGALVGRAGVGGCSYDRGLVYGILEWTMTYWVSRQEESVLIKQAGKWSGWASFLDHDACGNARGDMGVCR